MGAFLSAVLGWNPVPCLCWASAQPEPPAPHLFKKLYLFSNRLSLSCDPPASILTPARVTGLTGSRCGGFQDPRTGRRPHPATRAPWLWRRKQMAAPGTSLSCSFGACSLCPGGGANPGRLFLGPFAQSWGHGCTPLPAPATKGSSSSQTTKTRSQAQREVRTKEGAPTFLGGLRTNLG